jgi:hypothetical protein
LKLAGRYRKKKAEFDVIRLARAISEAVWPTQRPGGFSREWVSGAMFSVRTSEKSSIPAGGPRVCLADTVLPEAGWNSGVVPGA